MVVVVPGCEPSKSERRWRIGDEESSGKAGQESISEEGNPEEEKEVITTRGGPYDAPP